MLAARAHPFDGMMAVYSCAKRQQQHTEARRNINYTQMHHMRNRRATTFVIVFDAPTHALLECRGVFDSMLCSLPSLTASDVLRQISRFDWMGDTLVDERTRLSISLDISYDAAIELSHTLTRTLDESILFVIYDCMNLPSIPLTANGDMDISSVGRGIVL